MHCEACAIEISPAPRSWTSLKRHFFSKKKGMILSCNPDLHLNLEAWIYLYFTCTDPRNSWKDLCFFRTNKGQWLICLAFLLRAPLHSRLLQFAHNKASLACVTLSTAVRMSLLFVNASDTLLLNVLLWTGYWTTSATAKRSVLVKLVTYTDVCHLYAEETSSLAGHEIRVLKWAVTTM